MESATFRKWLGRQGCPVDHGELQKRHEWRVMVTVHRAGQKTQVLLDGSHQILDTRVVRACKELGADPARLPGLKTRV